MPTLRALKQAIIGPTIATQHDTLLATIETQRARRQEVPAIRRRIGDLREEIRAKESQLTKAGGALRGYEADPLRWSVKASEARDQMASIRRAIAAMSDEIAADEKTLSEIAAATLPPVGTDLMRHHHERVTEAQGAVAKIRDALAASKAELAALEAASDPVIDLRRQLADTLAMQALGSASAEDVSAIEGKIAASENVASTTSARSQRLAATVAGLQDRLAQAEADLAMLSGATPALQWEAMAPELSQAETRYRDALAALVQASDGYRALAHILTSINPDTAFPPLPEPTTALRDPGQLRLAQAIEHEQARLSAMGI